MNTKLGLTVILTPLLFLIWLINCVQDARAEWEHVPGTEVIGSVRLLESDGLRLYAVGDTGFYLSFDDGYTWRRREIGRGIDDLFITAIGSGDGEVYVGAIDHGVFRSDDGGNTWKQINEGLHIFDHPKWGRRHGSVFQLLVTNSGMVINVGYHQGTHISGNRGDLWRNVTSEWKIPRGNPNYDFLLGSGIFSMTEFDGYLWAVYSSNSRSIYRSPDGGETWEHLPDLIYGAITDWAVLGDRLYVAGYHGFGRWNEAEFMWENLSRGLPEEPYMNRLAVNRGRVFAACYESDRGVWLYDQPSETWFPTGPRHVVVGSLISHGSDLYAGTENGIYRASIPTVQPYGKAAATWGAVKGETLAK